LGMDASPFFNSYAETHVAAANLPHWRQNGVLYFVTFRLADSLPSEKIQSLQLEREIWLRAHAPPLTPAEEKEFWKLFGARTQQLLDAGHGSCRLAKPGIRSIVDDSLRHFDGQRYELGRFAIAANHVHVLVRPLPGHELSQIVQAWKSYTARRINAALGRKGPVWQKESYDHIVRNASALWHIERYIEAHKK
ncbi:MAG: transposase, partial [Chthoniobacterales bacterium]